MSRSYRHGKYSRQVKLEYWHWLWSEPKYWRKIVKHKKRRSEFRKTKANIMKGFTDEAMLPLDCKPWIYYH